VVPHQNSVWNGKAIFLTVKAYSQIRPRGFRWGRRGPHSYERAEMTDGFARSANTLPIPIGCLLQITKIFRLRDRTALKPVRCQRTTVSGWTRTKACFQPAKAAEGSPRKTDQLPSVLADILPAGQQAAGAGQGFPEADSVVRTQHGSTIRRTHSTSAAWMPL
jgi:hypothetical protein